MKNSGIEWIGQIPDSWKVVQLASLFVEHKQKNVGMQCNNLLSLSYGNIKRKDIDTADGLLPESFENYNIVDNGDIILRLTDLQNDQRSLRTGLCLERGIVTSAYVTLRKRNSNLNSAFMHYYLHSFDVRKGFYGMGSGVRQGLSFDGIRKLEILVPPQKTQEAIVSYLSQKLTEVDKIIEVQQAQIEKLKEYKQSVITEAVTKGLDPTAPMKDSGVEWIGKIPEDWELIKIGSLFACRNEKVSDSEFSPLSVSRGGIVPQMENVAKSDAGDNRKLVLKNDFVINSRSDRKQSCGVSPLDGSVSLINTVLYPIAASVIIPEYVNIVMKNYGFAEEFYRWGHGIVADLWTTRWQEMKSIVLPIPSIEIQKQIVKTLSKRIDTINTLIALKQSKIEKLQEYKKIIDLRVRYR